jgi:hypothetical protein
MYFVQSTYRISAEGRVVFITIVWLCKAKANVYNTYMQTVFF